MMRGRTTIIGCLTAVLIIIAGAIPLFAQDEFRLQLIDVDASEFPLVRLTLATADDKSYPLTDYDQLILHENGAPISDVSFEKLLTGVDVTFVLDANPDIVGVDDDSGLTRAAKVQESIRRFADQYMNPDGLDRVSIIVPGDDGQSGRFILQDATLPAEVVSAIEAYEPVNLRPTPLNEMITLALDQVQQRGEHNRFHSILLFSDARRIANQLSYPDLTTQANDSNTPIFTAILGAVADEIETDSAQRLSIPTRAIIVHMPSGTETEQIYETWQQQGEQLLLTYQSQERQSGENQVSVNLGSAFASGNFTIDMQPPELFLAQDNIQIHRIGAAPDSALTDLQPAVQPLTVNITWPDGRPRKLSEATLFVNDQPQSLSDFLPDQPLQMLIFDWDISALGEGEVDLMVTVTDELGYQGASKVVPAQITLERPLVPTAVPTARPPIPIESELLEALPPVPLPSLPFTFPSWLSGDVAAGIVGVFLFLIVAVFWRNRGQKTTEEYYHPVRMPIVPALEKESEEVQENLIARLEPFGSAPTESIEFYGDNLTIGRDEADIIVPDKSLAILHARIRRQDDGYWLFDEGSAEGTYLNYDRLGLSPRLLKDGDVVQFGTVNYRFRLRPEGYEDVDDEPLMEEVLILDMDGLMVDSEPLSRRAWNQVLAELGSEPLEDTFYNTLIGHRLGDASEMLVTHYNLDIEPSELAWRKEVLSAEIRSSEMPVMPGLYKLLEALKQRGIRWGVTTSSPRHVAEEVLAKIDVLDNCQAVAAGDEVRKGKPHPDVYLLIAERLNKEPGQCIAFEDSATGCRAARAAGMMVVAIPNEKDMLNNFDCADRIMTSLQDVPDHLDDLLTELRQR